MDTNRLKFAKRLKEEMEVFRGLPDLPDDVAEAFDSMKLAVMRHRLDEWREISQDDMVNALYALQRLALRDDE